GNGPGRSRCAVLSSRISTTMSTTIFPVEEVNSLRAAAATAREVDDFHEADGWSKSSTDPMRLLEVFPTLQLKPGYTLRAYTFASGGNGNGVVWAMPVNAEFPEPELCDQVKGPV